DGKQTGAGPDCVDLKYKSYDPEHRLIEEQNPDEGVTRYFFDPIGNSRAVQTSVQATQAQFNVSVYDPLGRVLYTGLYTDKDHLLTTRDLVQAKVNDPT